MLKKLIIYVSLTIIFIVSVVIIVIKFNNLNLDVVKVDEDVTIKTNNLYKIENDTAYIKFNVNGFDNDVVTINYTLEANGNTYKGIYYFDKSNIYPSYEADANMPYKVIVNSYTKSEVNVKLSKITE